jgi:hypothetical protein
MSLDAETCKARIAETSPKAADATHPVTKDEYLRLAQCWDDTLRDIEVS